MVAKLPCLAVWPIFPCIASAQTLKVLEKSWLVLVRSDGLTTWDAQGPCLVLTASHWGRLRQLPETLLLLRSTEIPLQEIVKFLQCVQHKCQDIVVIRYGFARCFGSLQLVSEALNSFKHSLEQAPTIFITFHYSPWRAIWKSLQAIWRIGRFQRFSKCQRHLRSSAATLSASLIDLSPS